MISAYETCCHGKERSPRGLREQHRHERPERPEKHEPLQTGGRRRAAVPVSGK